MKLGFLGAGAMGGAIINGAVSAGVIDASDVIIYDLSEELLTQYEAIGANRADSPAELAAQSDIIVLAVKPQQAEVALSSLGSAAAFKAAISIMAGVTLAKLKVMLPAGTRILRTMPNTPALVGEGAFALCSETSFTAEEQAFAEKLFSALGIVEWMSEPLIDAACGLSGSGPAFVALFTEALADGGVLMGLPRKTALRLAEQTVLGSAKLLLETGKTPADLKDMVSSPGGTTIAGVQALEEGALRAAVMDAVERATEKSRELGK